MRVVDLERDMSDVIPTGTSADDEYLFRRMEAATLAALEPGPGRRILDSAAGLGQDGHELASRGAWAVRSEPSRRMVDLGKLLEARRPSEAALQRTAWTRAWGEMLPFRDDAFDAAFCKGALDHFDDPSRCIGELARVTRPEGRVVLSVTNFESLGHRLQRLLDRIFPILASRGRRPYHVPSDHFTRYDPALLRKQAARHLIIDEWRGLSLLWGVTAWSRLLEKLGGPAAQRLLRAADWIGARFPELSDVLLIVGRPRPRLH